MGPDIGPSISMRIMPQRPMAPPPEETLTEETTLPVQISPHELRILEKIWPLLSGDCWTKISLTEIGKQIGSQIYDYVTHLVSVGVLQKQGRVRSSRYQRGISLVVVRTRGGEEEVDLNNGEAVANMIRKMVSAVVQSSIEPEPSVTFSITTVPPAEEEVDSDKPLDVQDGNIGRHEVGRLKTAIVELELLKKRTEYRLHILREAKEILEALDSEKD